VQIALDLSWLASNLGATT